MEFDDLKQESYEKVLLWGESGRGKTYNAAKIALRVARAGGTVRYVDTESEGSSTMVNLIEDEDSEFEEEDVQNIQYERVSSYDGLYKLTAREEGSHKGLDLLVIDTLDHKHTWAIKEVTDSKKKSDADWNQYPMIYSAEKQLMEGFSDPSTNVLATIDPDSGSEDKPKGAQTNVKGYFSVVIQMVRDGSEWDNRVLNFVGRDDLITGGTGITDIDENLANHLKERSEL